METSTIVMGPFLFMCTLEALGKWRRRTAPLSLVMANAVGLAGVLLAGLQPERWCRYHIAEMLLCGALGIMLGHGINLMEEKRRPKIRTPDAD